MMRVGLFGGSFDPVHAAHVALAQVALESLALDEVKWLPAGQPWQKAGRTLAPAHHRTAMLRLALTGQPRQEIDERELRRSGPSYTVDTIEELCVETPAAQWFLIIGQDQYARFHTWHRWKDLLQRATLAVAARAGDSPHPSEEVAAVQHHCTVLPLPPFAVSSTDIRDRIAQGQPVEGLVPPPVARYIDQHHLYRGTPPN